MGQNTKIEWAHHTFNAWTGCTKVSPACDHCYAEAWAKRSGLVEWGAGKPRRLTTPANWKEPVKWQRQAEKTGQRFRVFANSLSDVFDAEVSNSWRDDLHRLITDTPNLDWLLLTKRPKVMREYYDDLCAPANVWGGTTAENQGMLQLRAPALMKVRLDRLFLSCEPLLERLDLSNLPYGDGRHRVDALTGMTYLIDGDRSDGPSPRMLNRIGWVIAGGESGSDARPMHPDWAMSLRDQCQAAGTHFLFKQWGNCLPCDFDGESENGGIAYQIDEEHSSVDYDILGRGRSVTAHGREFIRFPHKNTGRLLDGRTWDEVPA